jgi:hypothetical protein
MAIKELVEAHIIVSKYIFPYLALGSSLTQSTMTQLKEYSKAGTGRSGATRKIDSLIRFPHNSADVTRSTVLGNVSSYIRPVKMGQYPVGGFVNTKFSVIDESWARLTTVFLYSSCTTIWQITLHSSYIVTSGGRHFLINT